MTQEMISAARESWGQAVLVFWLAASLATLLGWIVGCLAITIGCVK